MSGNQYIPESPSANALGISLTLAQFVRALLRFKYVTALCIVLSLVGTAFAILENTMYSAQAALQVAKASSSTMESMTSRVGGVGRFGQDDAYRDKLIGHLQSRDFFDVVATAVREHPSYGPILHSLRLQRSQRMQSMLERLRLALPVGSLDDATAPDLAGMLMGSTAIYKDAQSGIFIVTTLRDSNLAVTMANIVVDLASSFVNRKELQEFDQAREYIGVRSEIIKKRLEELNAQIREVGAGVGDEKEQLVPIVPSTDLRREMEHARIKIQANNLQIEQQTRIMNQEDAKLLRAQLQGGSLTDEIRALRFQSEALAYRRKQLTLQGIDEASLDVQELSEELSATNARIEALLATNKKSKREENLPGTVSAAEAAIEKLTQENVRLETEIVATTEALKRAIVAEKDLPRQRQIFADLTRQVQGQYELLAELSRQGYQFDFQRISVQNKVRIVERAYQGGTRRSPNIRSSFLFSLLIALLVGAGISVTLETRSPRVSDVKDLKMFGFPLLGTVPEVKLGFLTRRMLWRGKRGTFAARRAEELILANSIAFKYLRTNLVEGGRGKAAATKVISIHSAAPGEGKTFISANLATSIALSGKRTLVLDTDILGSRMSEQLGIVQSQGLVEVLRGQVTVDEALIRGVRPNLDVLLAGERSSNSTELLADGAFEKLLLHLRTRYDVIVVDTAPIVLLPDALLVCELADTSLISVSIGQTRMQDLAQALASLMTRTDVKVRFIANRAPTPKLAGSYRYNAYRYAGPAGGSASAAGDQQDPPIAG